jgi:hypothetical protein
VTNASDRFGDYGLVGVLIYEVKADRFSVDTFLLSCRALGKGIEHRMLSNLGWRAERAGKGLVEIKYERTERNRPAFEFINFVGKQSHEPVERLSFTLPSQGLTVLQFEPDEGKRPNSDVRTPHKESVRSLSVVDASHLSSGMQKIAEELYAIGQISAAIDGFRLQQAPASAGEFVTPANALQERLATIWKKVLGRTQIGMNENFFDAGGTSLAAVRVVAMIKQELKQNLSIIVLFECPTIELLAAKLESRTNAERGEHGSNNAEMRGRQRRYKVLKQRTL